MTKKQCVLLLFLLITTVTFAQFPQMPAQGQVKVDSMKSVILNVYRNIGLSSQKLYNQSGEKIPGALFASRSFRQQQRMGAARSSADVANKLIDAGEAVEMIIVVPDAGRIWDGYFDMEGWPYKRFFSPNFYPTLKSNTALSAIAAPCHCRPFDGVERNDCLRAETSRTVFVGYAMSALMGLEPGGGMQIDDNKFKA
jgi:hypothetical protein